MNVKQIKLEYFGDSTGKLLPIEHFDLPFKVKRTYVITETTSGVIRGKHAHFNLEQVIICLKGSLKINCDDGDIKHTFCLNGLGDSIQLTGIIWRELFDFSEHCVVMVLASQNYDEDDYIRSYDEFLEVVG